MKVAEYASAYDIEPLAYYNGDSLVLLDGRSIFINFKIAISELLNFGFNFLSYQIQSLLIFNCTLQLANLVGVISHIGQCKSAFLPCN